MAEIRYVVLFIVVVITNEIGYASDIAIAIIAAAYFIAVTIDEAVNKIIEGSE